MWWPAQNDFNYHILDVTEHRPWPLPSSRWVMTQTWHDLLFAHWPVELGVLRAKVPSAFPVDTFDGQAWIGIVPFHMSNVAPRGVPALPWISAFPELNVRTYVTLDGKPGVVPLQPGRREPDCGADGPAACSPALLHRCDARRAEGRLDRLPEPSHRRACGASGVRRTLRPGQPRHTSAAWNPGVFSDREILPLHRGPEGAILPAGHPPPSVAAADGGRRVLDQHHGASAGHQASRRSAAAAFRKAPGHGRVAASGVLTLTGFGIRGSGFGSRGLGTGDWELVTGDW